MLDLCKVAGAGITTGTIFTFRVTLSDVTRIVSVTAGDCARLTVPRSSSPLSKGYFQNTAGAVTQLIPSSALLAIDGSQLSGAQLQAILSSAPNVTASSSLLLNLTQQLIAAQLNILRGVQPSAAVLQAIAQAHVAIQIAVSGQIQVTTSLSPAQLSGITNTLSAFNEGKIKLAATPSAASLQIVENIPPFGEVESIVCNPAPRCSNIDLLGGGVSATAVSDALTAVTYTDRAKPSIRVCKVAGAGVSAGTTFRFRLERYQGQTKIDEEVLTVAAGSCDEIEVTAGSTWRVSEDDPSVLPPNNPYTIQAVSCTPAAPCTISGNVAELVAPSAGATTVTFTNRSARGAVRVCKVAGAGVTAGTEFFFRLQRFDNGNMVEETGGDVTAGSCRDFVVQEGAWTVKEDDARLVPPNNQYAASNVTCDLPCTATLSIIPYATFDLQAATTITVTFTNRSTQVTLRVCKAAGTGVAAGTSFSFLLERYDSGVKVEEAGGDVAAGSCSDFVVREGTWTVTEADAKVIPPNNLYAISDVTCNPAQLCTVSSSVATVVLQGGDSVTVTITNVAVP